MKKLFAALIVLSASQVVAEPNMDKYNKSCLICHAAGVANAPKTGDAAAWEPRLAKGMDVLVSSVEKGMGAMPPRGMCNDCSKEEFQALIEFMAKPAE
jgi:cytochrome c5